MLLYFDPFGGQNKGGWGVPPQAPAGATPSVGSPSLGKGRRGWVFERVPATEGGESTYKTPSLSLLFSPLMVG